MTATATLTVPPKFTRRGRQYQIDGEPVPSVTTILKEGFPSPALITWAARETAAYAVDEWEHLGGLTTSARLHELEGAAWKRRDAAAMRGTQIHAHGEALVAGKAIDVPAQHRGPVEAYARFLDAWDVQPLAVETPVCHPEHGWAGTPDLVALLRDGSTYLLDIKTGKGIYESHCLQAAAYRHAQWFLDGGVVKPWPMADRAAAVHVTADSAELVPMDASHATYVTFWHAAQVARWATRARQAWKDGTPWPVGRPVEPPAA